MSTHIILVCNASRAFLYNTAKLYSKEPLQFITELLHMESREKGVALVTDRSGHYQTDHKARGVYEYPIEPKEHEKDVFAKQVADYLEEHYKKNSFQQLIIITPPHFLGLLKKHFSASISQVITQIIQKDYTLKKEPELRKILQYYNKRKASLKI